MIVPPPPPQNRTLEFSTSLVRGDGDPCGFFFSAPHDGIPLSIPGVEEWDDMTPGGDNVHLKLTIAHGPGPVDFVLSSVDQCGNPFQATFHTTWDGSDAWFDLGPMNAPWPTSDNIVIISLHV